MPKKSKKKVYKTKAAAKSAATKGRYPYKVKGGWSLSKKATKKRAKPKKKATKKKAKPKKKKRATKKKAKPKKKKRAKRKTASPKRRRGRRTKAVSPRSLLGLAEKKWFANTEAAFKSHWAKNFASASSAEGFARGIAGVTGLSLKTIKASLPMKNFRRAQKNSKMYQTIALQKIREAYKTKAWSKGYKKAFGG